MPKKEKAPKEKETNKQKTPLNAWGGKNSPLVSKYPLHSNRISIYNLARSCNAAHEDSTGQEAHLIPHSVPLIRLLPLPQASTSAGCPSPQRGIISAAPSRRPRSAYR